MTGVITRVWPVGNGPYCGNMLIMSGCVLECGRVYGGCIVPPEDREEENRKRRETFAAQGEKP